MDNNNQQANANTNPAAGSNIDPSQAGTNAQQGTPEKKYTDEDVNDIIARRLAKMQKKHDEEIADIKAKATMNDDQKRSYEAEQKDKALAAAQAELNALKLTQVATKALSAKGYTVDEPLSFATIRFFATLKPIKKVRKKYECFDTIRFYAI